MPSEAREIVFNPCLYDQGKRYVLRAAVVMPDHVHMILIPLIEEQKQRVWPLPEVLDAVKAHLLI